VNFIDDIFLFIGHFFKVYRHSSLCLDSSLKGGSLCNLIQATSNCYFCWLRCYVPWWYSSCWKVWLIQFLHSILYLKHGEANIEGSDRILIVYMGYSWFGLERNTELLQQFDKTQLNRLVNQLCGFQPSWKYLYKKKTDSFWNQTGSTFAKNRIDFLWIDMYKIAIINQW